jgi:hypothetical protein
VSRKTQRGRKVADDEVGLGVVDQGLQCAYHERQAVGIGEALQRQDIGVARCAERIWNGLAPDRRLKNLEWDVAEQGPRDGEVLDGQYRGVIMCRYLMRDFEQFDDVSQAVPKLSVQ